MDQLEENSAHQRNQQAMGGELPFLEERVDTARISLSLQLELPKLRSISQKTYLASN